MSGHSAQEILRLQTDTARPACGSAALNYSEARESAEPAPGLRVATSDPRAAKAQASRERGPVQTSLQSDGASL